MTSVRDDWRVLLTGPGLAVRGGTPPPAWQLALLHPDGPASWTLLLSVPVLLAGLVAMLRRDRASGAMTALAVLGLTGLALGLLAPHLVLATDPAAALEVTAWPGTGLDLWALCLLFAALLGLDGLSRRLPSGVGRPPCARRRPGRRRGSGVVGSAAVAGWQGASGRPATAGGRRPRGRRRPGDRTAGRPHARPRPATAPRCATASSAASPARWSARCRAGHERPCAAGRRPGHGHRRAAADANLARTRLADLGIGFVALEGRPDPDRLLRLDSTAGLIRLGDQRDLMLWRVLPRQGAGAGATVPSARARLQTPAGRGCCSPWTCPATTPAPPCAFPPVEPAGCSSSPSRWAGSGTPTSATPAGSSTRCPGAASRPTRCPPAPAGCDIEVSPTTPWWRWGQGALLALVVFLALPFGRRRSRRAS